MPVGIGFQTRALTLEKNTYPLYIIILTVSNHKCFKNQNHEKCNKFVLLLLKTSKSISLTFMAKNQHTYKKALYFSKKLPSRQKLGIIVE